MHILKMHIYACLVLHFCAFFVHTYAYGIFAYMCIFWFCIFYHIYACYAHILHISYFLFCVYSCIFGTACCCIFRAYFCIFKFEYYAIFTLMHIQAYNTYLHDIKCMFMYILGLLCTYIEYFSYAYL